jgi:hypothetical protein
MERSRTNVLQQKARTRGLSDEEAQELGRLLAQAQGRPYSNAADLEVEGTVRVGSKGRPRGRARHRFLRGGERRPLGRIRSPEIGEIALTSSSSEDSQSQEELEDLLSR